MWGFATKPFPGLWALAGWKSPERKYHHLLSHTNNPVLGSDFSLQNQKLEATHTQFLHHASVTYPLLYIINSRYVSKGTWLYLPIAFQVKCARLPHEHQVLVRRDYSGEGGREQEVDTPQKADEIGLQEVPEGHRLSSRKSSTFLLTPPSDEQTPERKLSQNDLWTEWNLQSQDAGNKTQKWWRWSKTGIFFFFRKKWSWRIGQLDRKRGIVVFSMPDSCLILDKPS